MSSDVRDILELNQPSTTSNISKKVIYSYYLTNKSQAFKFLLNKNPEEDQASYRADKAPAGCSSWSVGPDL